MTSPRSILIPLAGPYEAAVAVRNWFFEKGILRVASMDVPVISVGNIAAGGTGKTPFVAFAASFLRQLGARVAIVSRGYGRRSKGYLVVSNGRQRCAEPWNGGDEPAELAEAVDGAIVAVGERRVEAMQQVTRAFHPDVIVLDDAFQHRYAARDLDIVLVTAAEIIRGDRLLPAGNRREPLSSLRRADLIVVTRCRNAEEFETARDRLSKFNKPIAGVRTTPTGLSRTATGDMVEQGSVPGRTAVLVSGVANPAAVAQSAADLGFVVAEHLRYRDHHWFIDADVREIGAAFRRRAAHVILTTAKDAVRLRSRHADFVAAHPVYTIRIGIEFLSGREIVERVLRKVSGR